MGNKGSKPENENGESGVPKETKKPGADDEDDGGKPKVKGAHDVVFVDDDIKEIQQSVGFSPSIFIGREFKALKKFCNARKVHQRHLNFLFKKYLSGDDIYLREFRVRTYDLKEHFDTKTKLFQEISEIYIPTVYTKEFHGLEPFHSLGEVTFTRFVILTYIFCAQPLPDLFFELFCILRQRFNLQHTATVFAFNVEQLVGIFGEDIRPCTTSKYLQKLLKEIPKDKEYSIGEVIKMAIKYPLMFYAIKRFRNHVRRMFLGDKFWDSQKLLKSKLGDLGIKKGFEVVFENENTARLCTCKAIICDIIDQKMGQVQLRWETSENANITELSDTFCSHIKKSIGYRQARKIILESGLAYPTEGQLFLNGEVFRNPENQQFHDPLSGNDVVYNNATGRRAWVLKYNYVTYDENDLSVEGVKEVEIDTEPGGKGSLLEYHPDEDDEEWTSDEED